MHILEDEDERRSGRAPLEVAPQAVAKLFPQVFRGNRRVGDLPQRHNRVFVVVSINR